MTPTNEQLRVKVAKAEGLCTYRGRWLEIEPYVEHNQDATYKCPACDVESEMHFHRLPNYPADLNACAELRAGMTDEERTRYTDALFGIVERSRHGLVWDALNAAPEQHCLAYLAAKGVSTEGEE